MSRSTGPATPGLPGTTDAPARLSPGVERQVFESLSLGLVVFDRGMRVSYRNPAADALLPLGSDLAEALHAIVRDPRYPDWTAVLGEVWSIVTSGEWSRCVARVTPAAESSWTCFAFRCGRWR